MASEFEEFTDDIALHCSTPEIGELLELWDDACQSQGGGVPTLAELNLVTLARYRASLLLLEEEEAGGFVWLYFGSAVAAHAGLDMTGQSTRGLEGEIADYLAQCYGRAKEQRKPLYSRHVAALSEGVTCWEYLVLPLLRGDDHVLLLVYSTPYKFREAFLDSVLAASSTAILALKVVRDADGQMVDAIVLSHNQQAMTYAKIETEADGIGQSVVDVYGSIVGPEEWSHFEEATANQSSEQYDTPLSNDSSGRSFRVSINPLKDMPDVVSLTFLDISDLRNDYERLREEQSHLIFANESLEKQASDLVALAEQLEKSRGDLTVEMERRRALEVQLRAMADIDPLTELYNRRAFLRFGNDRLQKANATGRPISMLVVDVDHFKQVNDTYGHTAGDAAIIMIAQMFGSYSGNKEVTARMGGEEFAIMLPNCDLAAAMSMAEAMRAQIAGMVVKSGNAEFKLTASFGVAQIEGPTDTIESLFDRADQALFDAKNAGRNQVKAFKNTNSDIAEAYSTSDMTVMSGSGD